MLPKRYLHKNFDIEEKVVYKPKTTKIISIWDSMRPNREWIKIINTMTKSSNTEIIYAGLEEYVSIPYDHYLYFPIVKKEKWFKDVLTKICNNRNVSLTILTGGHVYLNEPDYYSEILPKYELTKLKSLLESEYIKIISIPYIWFYFSISTQFHEIYIDIYDLIRTPKSKLFITMIKRSKEFRNFGIDMLAKHNLINDKSVMTVRNSEVINTDNTRRIHIKSSIFNYPFKYWEPKIMTFDQDVGDSSTIMKNFPNKEYASSFIELVFESQTEFVDISEKSIRPMLFMKPFLLIGDPNLNLRIKEYGFEIFEELFDYSFDKIENVEERIEGAILQLKRYEDLGPEDYDALYKKLLPKLKHNFKRLLTFDKYYPLPEEVLKVPQYVRHLYIRKAFLKRHEHLLEMDIDR